MPSFILRNIPDGFWRNVKAKAAQEGISIKDLIFKLLTKWLAVVLMALLASACTTPYKASPLGPTPSVVIPPANPNPPPPQPLLVTLSIGVTDPAPGTNISFVALTNGSAIARAEWSFGNGATASTVTADTAYAYPAPGTYDARVTVTASDGRTGSARQTVTVTRRPPPPPPPTPAPPPSTPTGFDVTVSCTPKPAGSATPCQVTTRWNGTVQPSSSVYQVNWDFGDGTTVTTFVPVASHVYTGAGTYTVFADVFAHLPPPPGGPGGNDHEVVSTSVTVP